MEHERGVPEGPPEANRGLYSRLVSQRVVCCDMYKTNHDTEG